MHAARTPKPFRQVQHPKSRALLTCPARPRLGVHLETPILFGTPRKNEQNPYNTASLSAGGRLHFVSTLQSPKASITCRPKRLQTRKYLERTTPTRTLSRTHILHYCATNAIAIASLAACGMPSLCRIELRIQRVISSIVAQNLLHKAFRFSKRNRVREGFHIRRFCFAPLVHVPRTRVI